MTWKDHGSEKWKFFVLLYFLVDDRVEIYESKDFRINPCRQNTFPVFLSKTKLPKDWRKLPSKLYIFLTLTYLFGFIIILTIF